MRMNVIVGRPEMFYPEYIPVEELIACWPIEQERIVIPSARWISARCGLFYHDFLKDSERDEIERVDRREIFGRFIADTFSSQPTPTLIFPSLVDPQGRFNNAFLDAIRVVIHTASIREINFIEFTSIEHEVPPLIDVFLKAQLERAFAEQSHALNFPRVSALGNLKTRMSRNVLLNSLHKAAAAELRRVGFEVDDVNLGSAIVDSFERLGARLRSDVSMDQLQELARICLRDWAGIRRLGKEFN